MFANGTLMWIGFNLFIAGMLFLDLGLLHRKAHWVSVREASVWVAVWVSLALLFGVGVYSWWGTDAALQFFTGYLIEESLSVDNIFVFIMIFSYFAVPPQFQHRVLFWGIVGALGMRLTFILAGIALLNLFHWLVYALGAILIASGVKMATQKTETLDPEANPALRLVRRYLPVTEGYEGQRFFVRRNGKLMATPLLLVLVLVETTDLVFALDSIPAILAITRDPFLVYTSNAFAILGLRSIYFLLAGIMGLFRYLRHGLAVVLSFVGVKMILADVVHIPVGVSLAVVFSVLATAVIASLVVPARAPAAGGEPGSAAARKQGAEPRPRGDTGPP